ncbi:MAG: hypothetical protein IPK60_24095 [Sandaracinaceae bacterium]|nr:hypothetical protein [Sandaracinaceae bacterium]
MKNFHLPLSKELHAELSAAASSIGKPATRLAQEFVARGLAEFRRTLRRRDIAAYASKVAGSGDDLDELLESASLKHLSGRER